MNSPFQPRKQPPHLPPLPRHNTPIVLFVTITIQPRVNALANDMFHHAFLRAVDEADAWRVFLHVILPDHIHLFAVPGTHPPYPIKKWAEFLKKRVGIKIGPHPQWHWQPGCWDTQIRNREHYEEKTSYVRMNPVRAGLCASPDEWKWRGEKEWVVW